MLSYRQVIFLIDLTMTETFQWSLYEHIIERHRLALVRDPDFTFLDETISRHPGLGGGLTHCVSESSDRAAQGPLLAFLNSAFMTNDSYFF